MGCYTAEAEELVIRGVLAGQAKLDEVVYTPDEVAAQPGFAGLLARLFAAGDTAAQAEPAPAPLSVGGLVFADDMAFLRDAMAQAVATPSKPPGSGGSGAGRRSTSTSRWSSSLRHRTCDAGLRCSPVVPARPTRGRASSPHDKQRPRTGRPGRCQT